MSYQVLARKWRPKSFGTLVGQEHVVRALTHALATGRLHHAWLFTGTRGVGKTTISRILAKALNCETGVTAEPCGECEACRAIDADRFPDYVEMDAASNRGVDDMAALLDKAVYAPVQGRYKVYMIDEVHMLTGHAFNAMLKTLEEPPEHVKFILATTDPQKIPVTVLSRCLQFNLKQMPPGHIVDHLTRILQAEAVPFEPGALRHLAKAASGSMRDALSLLDQSIAHGAGKVEEEQVTHMLGTVGDDHLYAVLDALAAGSVAGLVAVADGMEARSLSFDAALQSLASLFHRIALAQHAPEAITDEVERARIVAYVAAFDAEFLQLAYQIAIHGRDELPLAPDEYTGFAMTLLRLHAFRPEQPAALGSPGVAPAGSGQARGPVVPAAVQPPAASPRAPAGEAPEPAKPSAGPVPASAATEPGKAGGAAPLRVAELRVPRAAQAAAPIAPSAPPAAGSRPAEPPPPSADMPRCAELGAVPVPAPAPSGGDHDVPPWEELPPEAYAGDYPASALVPPAVPVGAVVAGAREAGPASAVAAVQPGEPVATAEPEVPLTAGAAVPTATGGDVAALLAMGDWRGLIRALGLSGLMRELAQHCEWLDFDDGELRLRLSNAHRHLFDMNRAAAERLQDMLGNAAGRALRVRIEVGDIAGETPAQRDEIERRARHAEAVAALEADPFVRELIERFDATLVENSVKPL
ncbi:DNA polymerase III subunit gamma/tau [Thauera butanivorans]|uniref:DNA polymerase III subunit gamma/tau n=1 Tax=Thauera butanivorans TaxID=86174 RepID=UPI000837EA6B|nr:DNA polymerase III subunit gamma/tau [Thauera butanivorans]